MESTPRLVYCQHLINPSIGGWSSGGDALTTVPVDGAISKPVKLTVVARLPRYMSLANCKSALVVSC